MPIPRNGLRYPQLESSSDNELMEYLKVGYHDALAVIFDRYQNVVWRVARRIVYDQEEAAEVVRSVFLELFQNVDQFNQDRGTLKWWLLQLAYTRSVNRACHLRCRQFFNTNVSEEEVLRPTPVNTSSKYPQAETTLLVRQALETLDANQRTTVELIAFHGLTFEELAERTGQTLTNAKHQYYLGVMKLRDCLATRQHRDSFQ